MIFRQFRIINNNRNEQNDIQNVFGIIKGEVEPDKYILVGNHIDAWMYGAIDPISGSAVTMEMARVFGELMKTGLTSIALILSSIYAS